MQRKLFSLVLDETIENFVLQKEHKMESIQHRLDVLYKRYWLQQIILSWETIIFNQFITGLFHWCNLVNSTSLWLQQKDTMHTGKVKITSVEHLQNSPRKWYCLWDAVEHPNLISKRGTMQHQSKFQSLGSISDHYSEREVVWKVTHKNSH